MKRLEVWLVNLDPTVESEVRKTRPAVIVSPDELNADLRTVIVVPLTTGRSYPFRIATRVGGKPRVAAIDQLRAIDKPRLVRKTGRIEGSTPTKILAAIAEMFAA
ncbi:mRNA interferase MazF9 [Botrimarina colliarenosi]|uniref:mRNA interferase n=1 Tax=Botrimarina colliarenosi TaxID=2528001 RepID=A0A5C6AKC6_9BACT|nr:type II toxin-antitoxin system PemK/MazF family toxin [Botrimarina colliarenosi]TWT99957.1 mRNA interferase MazF9 [Botrimarina colliarenosi]